VAELTSVPRSLAGLRGLTSKKERGEKGEKMGKE